jgi:hypothetical protein
LMVVKKREPSGSPSRKFVVGRVKASEMTRPYGLTESRSGCLIPVANVGYPPKRTYPQC